MRYYQSGEEEAEVQVEEEEAKRWPTLEKLLAQCSVSGIHAVQNTVEWNKVVVLLPQFLKLDLQLE